MIKRYEHPKIAEIWSLINKYELWQKVELAVIQARCNLGRIARPIYEQIKELLKKNPISPQVIEQKEAMLHHDLNAFLDERLDYLPIELHAEFHRDMTSYDTEESAFIKMIRASSHLVNVELNYLQDSIQKKALTYRYTPMNGRTHGQEAELQSFGKRCATWFSDLDIAKKSFCQAMENLAYSKLSGAIGTNSDIDPKLEKEALGILGLEPFVGATQIMPRVIYAPLASSLANIAVQIQKIADDIRLGARSGRPLFHEPFGKKQKGSSAMPHKKNTIMCENLVGMARMARKYAEGIQENIPTWEERDISQSSVERVFWPDLFHVTIRSIVVMRKLMDGLVVYPENMMIEIHESKGTYASNKAKELILELGTPFGLERKDAYRLIQLACFNIFQTDSSGKATSIPGSLEEADHYFFTYHPVRLKATLEDIVLNGGLRPTDELDIDPEKVIAWNNLLLDIFKSNEARERWKRIFQPSIILANEAHIFEKIFQ